MRTARKISPRTYAAWKAAIAQRQPWLTSTGPTSAEGKRRVTQNSTLHGLEGQAMLWALRYIAAVQEALLE